MPFVDETEAGLLVAEVGQEPWVPTWYCCEKHKQACLELRYIGDDPHSADHPDGV